MPAHQSRQKKPDYYSQGSTDVIEETPLTLKKLEPRRQLTRNSTRLVIALVGLPARGKSFVARKLEAYLNWNGAECKIFNVGRYRREAYANIVASQQRTAITTSSTTADTDHSVRRVQTPGACDANFFDSHNQAAAQLREKVAELALEDMLKWLDNEPEEDESSDNSSEEDTGGGRASSNASSTSTQQPRLNFHRYERVAIFDATNSTDKRRQWILEQCTCPEKRRDKPTGVVFVESVCDDQELLEENYRYKVNSSPDYDGMSQDEAIQDLRMRVQKYEEQYETILNDSLSYIKVFNLSTKLMVNHIYGRMAKELVPALMAWHIGTRPVFLARPGQTISGILTDGEDYVARNKISKNDPRFLDMSGRTRRKNLRGDSLGPSGKCFRAELMEYCFDEAHAFMFARASVHDMADTGTSISGLAPVSSSSVRTENAHKPKDNKNNSQNSLDHEDDGDHRDPFPLRILTSTMPRAIDTVNWDEFPFPINQMSNLNPLDKGDFNGMELDEIRMTNPTWYKKLEKDAFGTRFPGGESYRDLIRRVTSVVIDIEQQVIPTLVVSHVSILQCLMAYFNNTPVEQCMSIEVPMHTVIKFTPVRGGGWSESRHRLCDAVTNSRYNSDFSFPRPENISSHINVNKMPQMPSASEVTPESTRNIMQEPPPSSPIWGDHVSARVVKGTAAAS